MGMETGFWASNQALAQHMPADRDKISHPPADRRSLVLWAVLALAIGATIVFLANRQWGQEGRGPSEGLIREVVDSEELILELTPRLDRLSRSALNLQLPSGGARKLFAHQVTVSNLGKAVKLASDEEAGGASVATIRELELAGEPETIPREKLSLWSGIFDDIDFLEHASFKIVRGEFVAKGEFETLVKFGAAAQLHSGGRAGLAGKLLLSWRRESAPGSWQITAWQTKSVHLTASAGGTLFSDQLDSALPNPSQRRRARHSIHQEELVKYYHSGKRRARSHDFAPIALPQKPGLAVVDIDRNGFDDIYLMVRMGENLLLRNRGDGTFEEAAQAHELAVSGNSTCGIFADFDNDGDADLLLGRSVERCLYLENNGSWFTESKAPWTQELPLLAVSISAADYNRDGLLDFYVCTYRPEALGDSNPGLGGGGSGNTGLTWPERFLSGKEAARYMRLHNGGDHHFLDQIGPPNSLWVNRGGGRFERAPENELVGIWENTLQATWADYDADGDPDLYLANDFAHDNLFRNDGQDGFTDVTGPSGADTYGFGMGASFGDYDRDGLLDLYVSNMYSKAGRRILAQFNGIGDDYMKSAEGNVLYRQGAGGQFEQVSALEPPGLTVAEAGWSWGGQFADFDNDGDLDIYALSGYFTAPREVASELDL